MNWKTEKKKKVEKEKKKTHNEIRNITKKK